MANGETGSLFKKYMDDPEVLSRAEEADKAYGTGLTDLYKRLRQNEKTFDYNQAVTNFKNPKIPSIVSPKPSIESDLAGGNAIQGPNIQEQLQYSDTYQRFSELNNRIKDSEFARDPYKWAKPYSFNTGVNNADFDRYYTHPLYDKLGYSPFRDNETLYNEKASWADDFSRMSKQFLGLTWGAAKSMYGANDPEDMDRRMKIAQTTKGGIGGFTTNFLSNASYMIGVAIPMIAEELVLMGATAATGGVTAPGTLPEMAGVAVRGGTKIAQAAKAMFRTGELLKSFKDVEKAREFWKASKGAVLGTAEFLNPLRYTTRELYGLAKGAGKYENLGDLAKISTTAGGFLRDMIRLQTAYSESKLEGDSEQIRITDELIGDYY